MKDVLKNKAVIIGLAIIAIVILLAVFSAGSEPTPVAAPSRAPAFKSSQLQITSLSDEKKARMTEYRRSIVEKLPIYIQGYKTPSGKETTINIYVYEKDSPEIIRLEVYGLSYKTIDQDPKQNPDALAYADSYREAMRLLQEKGIDPKMVVFAYGEAEHMRSAAAKWIDAFDLAP